jgi:excisionase family DNA binding protein
MDKEFLSVRDIAKMLGVTVDTIQAYIRRGELTAIKIGNKYVVERKEFERFLQERRTRKDGE